MKTCESTMQYDSKALYRNSMFKLSTSGPKSPLINRLMKLCEQQIFML